MTALLYWQIVQELRQAIESGRLRPGKHLPTEPELRETYGASRNTIRDAVKWLANRGLVESRPGLGTFVAERLDMFVTTLSADRRPDSAAARGPPRSSKSRPGAGGPRRRLPR